MLIAQGAIEEAANRLRPYLVPTPAVRSSYYSARTGANVFLKLETVQPTHSFKVRGAFSALLALPAAERLRGVVTASQGNHGLGLTFAAKTLGLPVAVYLAHNTPLRRLNMLRDLGAEIVLHGDSWDAANQRAREVANNEGKAYVHPFNDAQVMAGQATILVELLTQLPSVDLVVASIGGGGLLSGLISAARHISPHTRLVGVETVGADCMYRSRAAGSIVELPAITSIATSLGAKRTELPQFEIITEHASDLVVVPDQAAVQAIIEILNQEKLLVEPAAACTLAALTAGRIPIKPGENVAVILCGANVTLDEVIEWSTRFVDDYQPV
jgi:threonine dehydratase